VYAAQAIPPIDAEIAEKGHFWTETSYVYRKAIGRKHSQRPPRLSIRMPIEFNMSQAFWVSVELSS
jgi:hypothetical protein